jgi:hypothetical protein
MNQYCRMIHLKFDTQRGQVTFPHSINHRQVVKSENFEDLIDHCIKNR